MYEFVTFLKSAGRSIFHCCWTLGLDNLPLHLRDSELTLQEFRRVLKTHLFIWGLQHLVTDVVLERVTKSMYLLTYLLTYLVTYFQQSAC